MMGVHGEDRETERGRLQADLAHARQQAALSKAAYQETKKLLKDQTKRLAQAREENERLEHARHQEQLSRAAAWRDRNEARARLSALEEALQPFIAIYERYKDTPDADGCYEEIGFPTIRRLVEARGEKAT
jgi:chromosome segregation ATPase